MLVAWNGKRRVDQEKEAGQGWERANPECEEGSCAGRVRGVKKSAAEGGDEGMRWIGDGSDVSEGWREDLLLVREQNRRDVRSTDANLSISEVFSNGRSVCSVLTAS